MEFRGGRLGSWLLSGSISWSRPVLTLLVPGIAAGVLAGASPVVSAQEKITVTIGTGFTTGVYHPIGVGIANILSKYLPRYQAKVESTGGSVDNLRLLGTDRIDLGLSMADAGWDAYTGIDRFKSGSLPLRTLAVLYANRMHVVTLDGNGIEKVADLKDKRLATGAPGSATEVMALRVLEAYGIDPQGDVRRERLSLEESISALRDRSIDALFWVGGAPTAAIAKFAVTPGIKLKLLDHGDAVVEMNKRHGPLYVRYVIPARAYSGLVRDVSIAGVWNILVASQKMSDQVAYDIVKTIFDHRAELAGVHREAENISLDWQRSNATPIPFHPGAIKYFTEKGVRPK
jgi:uncharacterized protein